MKFTKLFIKFLVSMIISALGISVIASYKSILFSILIFVIKVTSLIIIPSCPVAISVIATRPILISIVVVILTILVFETMSGLLFTVMGSNVSSWGTSIWWWRSSSILLGFVVIFVLVIVMIVFLWILFYISSDSIILFRILSLNKFITMMIFNTLIISFMVVFVIIILFLLNSFFIRFISFSILMRYIRRSLFINLFIILNSKIFFFLLNFWS